MSFVLELPPVSAYFNENAKRKVSVDARKFGEEYRKTHLDKITDVNLGHMLKELEDGCFWGVLTRIDGSSDPVTSNPFSVSNPFVDQPDSEKERSREWAMINFTPKELQMILDIITRTALISPRATASPGTNKGHSILYQHLIEKPNSIFSGVADESIRKRLNNGRLWEELPDMQKGLNSGLSYRYVQDALTKYFGDLDANFAPIGFKIFYRNHGKNGIFDLEYISDRAVDNYLLFMSEIDKKKDELGLTTDDIQYLMASYVEAVLSFVDRDDGNGPVKRFGGRSSRSYRDRMKDPIVMDYVIKSKRVRDASISRR